jgi:amino-acid N-acetyltransferase
MDYTIRRARTQDVRAIAALVNVNFASRRLLGKATVTLYEDVQEFWVAERAADGVVVGCGALHVMWEDLAEIRTVAVHPDCQGQGIGHHLVDKLLGSAREVGVRRVFVLTFAIGFSGGTASPRSTGRPSRTRSTPSCSAPTTKASPSSLTSIGSSPTPSATTACCCSYNTAFLAGRRAGGAQGSGAHGRAGGTQTGGVGGWSSAPGHRNGP